MIECVPNLSEGRRTPVVSRLARAMQDCGCCVLDIHQDVDHGRSVITAVGGTEEMEEAAIALVSGAIKAIDLRGHVGVHPRIGAVDVFPFVPLERATMEECAALARRVGQRFADELRLPVFLYEYAAVEPARRNLAAVRRGGLPGVTARMRHPGGAPDCGPPSPHPTAGAIAVGARDVLVAFNVNLRTSNTRVARSIAAAIREANGGLPGVKALGFELASRGLTQVSMNLVDLGRTTLLDAYLSVERRASEMGIDVVESEIVGLVPQFALGGATADRIRYPGNLGEITIEARRAARCP